MHTIPRILIGLLLCILGIVWHFHNLDSTGLAYTGVGILLIYDSIKGADDRFKIPSLTLDRKPPKNLVYIAYTITIIVILWVIQFSLRL